MLLHAGDLERGLLASRYRAGGTAEAAILELQRVLATFDARVPAHTPLLHVMVCERGAALPGFSERALLSAVARSCKVPWWFACVSPSAMVRLAMDIVLLIAPTPALRRVEAFSTEAAAHAWLLSTRPDAHARLLSLVQQVAPGPSAVSAG